MATKRDVERAVALVVGMSVEARRVGSPWFSEATAEEVFVRFFSEETGTQFDPKRFRDAVKVGVAKATTLRKILGQVQ